MAELVVNQRAAVDIHLDIERSMIKQIGNMHVTASCLRLMADAQVNAAMRQDAIASNATMTEIRTRTNGTTYTVQVPDEAARAVARQSAAAHRALAQALRLKARAIGNAVVSLQIAMAQVKKDFNRIIDESIRIDRYHSERLNEIRGWMRSFTNRMHEIRNGINLQHPINAGEFAPTSMGVRKNTMLSFLEGCALAGMPHFTVFALDPVNTATGNFIYSKTDMSVGGRYPLEFTRFYNSIGGMENDVLGVNWTHNHNIRLYSQDEAVRIIYGDGHMETHGQLDDGGYLSPLENSNTLLLHTDEGFKLWTNDNVIYEFDKEGFLQTQSDINGNETKYEHTDGLLIKVSNPCGSMTFEYEDRQITKVTDHTGREVKLSYNGKMLGKVTHPSGAEYSYEYDSYGNLEKVTNPLGIEAISNEYDGHGRLTRQSFPDGGVATLRYDDKITTMTEQSGNVVKYERDDKYRTVKT
ncbi:MAG: DUF6531 domain-containing protein, partial [Oscillospiraceae bacterium]|nr:DUF6531 domain-containing protein [Oscillospiraceae bacterium]MCL2278829.1 DUF6531 domain-containing protein [Oscillospiraceae bacterium]